MIIEGNGSPVSFGPLNSYDFTGILADKLKSDSAGAIDHATKIIRMYSDRIKKLEEENKMLKSMSDHWEHQYNLKHDECIPIKRYVEVLEKVENELDYISSGRTKKKKWYKLWLFQ